MNKIDYLDNDINGTILPDNRDRNILNICKNDWKSVINMYAPFKNNHVNQLQWAPLTYDSPIYSTSFYENYVEDSSVVTLDSFWFRERYYAIRSDGNIRNISIISPLMFLVIESFGRYVWNNHNSRFDSHVFRYYAGDYGREDPRYKESYKTYCGKINSSEGYKYYLKTDIKNYYDTLSVDLLFETIIKKIDVDLEPQLYSLHFYKELIKYCGFGKYPTIDNSVALSYLASSLFLEDLDYDLSDYLYYQDYISDYKIVRYQDDMYVLFNVIESFKESNIQSILDDIENYYSSGLSRLGLSLNIEKTCSGRFLDSRPLFLNINYNDSYSTVKFKITCEELHTSFNQLLEQLSEEGSINRSSYRIAIDNSFHYDFSRGKGNSSTVNPIELFNDFVYNHSMSEEEAKKMNSLVSKKKKLVFLDPKRLFTLSIKVENKTIRDQLINELLHTLHCRKDEGKWDAYCSIAAIEYLLKTNRMCHTKLRQNLKEYSPGLDTFLVKFCDHMSSLFIGDKNIAVCNFLKTKPRAFFVYAMYRMMYESNDAITACAYCYSLKESINDNLIENSPYLKMPNADYKKRKQELLEYVYGEYNEEIKNFIDVRCSILLCHSKKDVKYKYYSQKELLDLISNYHAQILRV